MEAGDIVTITRDLRLRGRAEGIEALAVSESEVVLDGWPVVVGEDVEVEQGGGHCSSPTESEEVGEPVSSHGVGPIWVTTPSGESVELEPDIPVLLVLKELEQAGHVLVLVPDVRGPLHELTRRSRDFLPLERRGAAGVFHLLRDLQSKGFVQHTEKGYSLSPQGRRRATDLREEKPGVANLVTEATKVAVAD